MAITTFLTSLLYSVGRQLTPRMWRNSSLTRPHEQLHEEIHEEETANATAEREVERGAECGAESHGVALCASSGRGEERGGVEDEGAKAETFVETGSVVRAKPRTAHGTAKPRPGESRPPRSLGARRASLGHEPQEAQLEHTEHAEAVEAQPAVRMSALELADAALEAALNSRASGAGGGEAEGGGDEADGELVVGRDDTGEYPDAALGPHQVRRQGNGRGGGDCETSGALLEADPGSRYGGEGSLVELRDVATVGGGEEAQGKYPEAVEEPVAEKLVEKQRWEDGGEEKAVGGGGEEAAQPTMVDDVVEGVATKKRRQRLPTLESGLEKAEFFSSIFRVGARRRSANR